jgi:uncharacterized protein (TIGR02001 family)
MYKFKSDHYIRFFIKKEILSMNKTLNKYLLAALFVAPLAISANAQAEEAAAEATPDWSLSYNVGLYSDYIFRGVSLSDSGPAVQGGIDLVHSSGFFLGTWLSNIDTKVSAGNGLEVDLYGGYGYEFENGISVGALGNYYTYPEGKKAGISPKTFNTFEASVYISYANFTYTYFNILTDYYGAPNSKNAYYNELKYGTALPIAGLNLTTKVGYQDSANTGFDQGDFAIGLNRDFALPTTAGKAIEGFNAGATYSQLFDMQSGGDKNQTVMIYVKRSW